jgi:hypothetical protein
MGAEGKDDAVSAFCPSRGTLEARDKDAQTHPSTTLYIILAARSVRPSFPIIPFTGVRSDLTDPALDDRLDDAARGSKKVERTGDGIGEVALACLYEIRIDGLKSHTCVLVSSPPIASAA